MKVQLHNLHTIVMLCGISGSGKTTKAKQLNNLAKNAGLRSVVISSDDCRKELLLDTENTYHHHDTEMYQISDKAFELLKSKMGLYLKYPYNANVVILDMMNLSTQDREKIIALADENCYDIIAVVLDYSNIDDYFCCLDDKYDKRLIRAQLKKFRTKTMPELGRRKYDDLIRIKSKYEEIELGTDFDLNIDRLHLPNTKHSFIVSDIHECIRTFKELLKKVGFDIETIDGIEKITGRDDTVIIINGDYIDKGGNTKETIEFLYNNIGRLVFVDGNHESFVDRWLNPEIIKTNISSEKMKFYSSIPTLESDNDLKNKFLDLRKLTVPFCENKHFIVTHAGCKNKYLGKTQKFALREQRYYHTDRFENDKDDEWIANRRTKLNHLKDESEMCHPYHIFGHEAFKNTLIYKNKIHIDTGCCQDGKLTGIEINKNTGEYKLWSIACTEVTIKSEFAQEKLREFKFEEPEIELESRDENQIKWYARNKVNFISGTMCPADKRKNELEDINEALDYFKSKKIDEVMLQIKYMGSRCNVYLFDDIEKSYAVTRNGNLIKKLDLTSIYKKLRDRPFIRDYFKENNLELMIIDGELMPWSALGEGLIESVFSTIDKGIESELSLLEENGFEEQLAKLINKYKESDFDNDRHSMKKEDLYAKYGAQKYEAYKTLSKFSMPSIEELKELHKTYSRQLGIYAKPLNSDNELIYQPFSILKSVRKDGTEILYFDNNNESLFKMVNDAPYQICDLTTDEGYIKAKEFFDYVTKDLYLEGVVIKPLKVDNEYIAPYIKVRSPPYLTIIYGYDYPSQIKYQHLLDSKRIKFKLKMSIDEWNLGKKLLQIKYKDISEDNSEYKKLMAKMIVEVNKEVDLDPRL